MISKVILLVLTFLVIAFLFTSEVAARDMVESSIDQKNAEVATEYSEGGHGIHPNRRVGYGGGHGGGGGYGTGHRGRGGYPGHGGYGGGRGGNRCPHGCCEKANGGGCKRCCS